MPEGGQRLGSAARGRKWPLAWRFRSCCTPLMPGQRNSEPQRLVVLRQHMKRKEGAVFPARRYRCLPMTPTYSNSH